MINFLERFYWFHVIRKHKMSKSYSVISPNLTWYRCLTCRTDWIRG